MNEKICAGLNLHLQLIQMYMRDINYNILLFLSFGSHTFS